MAGEKDTLVPIGRQRQTMAVVRFRNGCSSAAAEWAPGCLLYPSSKGAPFVSFIHAGGHRYAPEAPALIVRFFKENPRKRPATPETRPR